MTTSIDSPLQPASDSERKIHSVWLEITGLCNLACTHCYAESGPDKSHGSLTKSEWKAVISDAKEVGAQSVQFIGGEPTLHPHFSELVKFATAQNVNVEIYSNLLRISAEMWELFEDCNVSLATSYYSSHPAVHDSITGNTRSHARTLANIAAAIERSLSVRVGLINVRPGQDIKHTLNELHSLGIANINVYPVRGVGRGRTYNEPLDPTDALCGHCAYSRAMVDADGFVYPCVFSRWLRVGNIRSERFSAIATGAKMREIQTGLIDKFQGRSPAQAPGPCSPLLFPPRPPPPPPCPPGPCSPTIFPPPR
jgi:MoaA/NifB/PqqE/SkfB family radical SAM enzyme